MEVGVDVIIGETNDERDAQDTLSFLDGFLEELIGHMPGETINFISCNISGHQSINLVLKTFLSHFIYLGRNIMKNS